MLRKKLLLAVLAMPLASAPEWADADAMRDHVEFLADAELEGRFTGSPGAARAADYLVEALTELGAQPLPGRDSFKSPLEFTAGVADGGSWIEVSGRHWDTQDSVRALSFSDVAEVSGEVVFAGYGLVIPEGREIAYDSYATLDVEDRIVVVLRYVPEDVDQETRVVMGRYSGLRHKAMAARERGAKAVLVVTGPNSPNAGETVRMRFDTAIAGSGIAAASISADVAERILAGSGRSLAELQSELDSGNLQVAGIAVPETEVTLSVAVEREKKTAHNVIGYLPADGEDAWSERPYIVLGAHFDHLGLGEHGSSLARKDETGLPHFGADDNASGVAVVLDLAARLRAEAMRRNVVLAFWTGEEIGLLGSGRFVKEAPVAMDQLAAYLNFDMVGRVEENKLILQAVGSSPAWRGVIERANVPVGFDLVLHDDAYLPTDSTAFHQQDVPTLNFFSGSHIDYHRPTDTPQAINYEDLERVAQLGFLIARKLANAEEPPEFTEVAVTADRETGSRDTVRIFTGTIPDYTAEAEGLRLSGVIEGGPAARAGLQEGDLIVQLGDQAITNVYDYMYALEAVKVDVTIPLVYVRDGQRIESEITPTARE